MKIHACINNIKLIFTYYYVINIFHMRDKLNSYGSFHRECILSAGVESSSAKDYGLPAVNALVFKAIINPKTNT